MKNNTLLFLAIITLAFSCKNQFELVEKFDDQGVKTESFHIDKQSGLIEGVYYKYFPSGKVEQQSDYKDNKLEGKRILFYENADTLIVESYANAQYVGPYKSYYPGNILESEGQYIAGKMEGEWKFYYKNNQIKEIVEFVENEENGSFTEYHENGMLKAKGTYKTTEENIDRDREHGPLDLYDEKGELFKKMNCTLGICKTTWKREEY